jgi:hypothetical protein
MTMTWSYIDPSTNDKDFIRMMLGDTLIADPLLYDEEINAFLTGDENNLWLVGHHCANALAARYTRLSDVTVGKTSISWHLKSAQYLILAKELANESAYHKAREGIPYAGGLIIADKESQEKDQSRVDPFFTRKQFDYPGTAPDVDKWSDDNGL